MSNDGDASNESMKDCILSRAEIGVACMTEQMTRNTLRPAVAFTVVYRDLESRRKLTVLSSITYGGLRYGDSYHVTACPSSLLLLAQLIEIMHFHKANQQASFVKVT